MTSGRSRTVPWPALIAVGLGIVAGLAVGAFYGYADSEPSQGSFYPPAFFPMIVAGALIGGLGIAGLLLSLRAAWRPVGRLLLVGLVGVVAGLPIGIVTGPRYQPPRVLPGTLSVDLAAPVVATLSATGTCTTVANGTRIAEVEARDLGSVGVDRLSVHVDVGDVPSAEFLVNGTFANAGPITITDAGLDALTGRASFTDLAARDGTQIGGPSGGATASGTLSWDCTTPGGGPSTQTAPPESEPLQGYFNLGGIVDVVEARATGTCAAEFDLRTDEIATVVPWVDGRQARLLLTPGRESATLTVDFADGTTPESATSPATLVELRGGTEDIVSTRRLEATFELQDGRLTVVVEWACSDSVERPAEP